VSVVGQIPLVFAHEAFHTLAGRRLGLRTKFSVGRRLYYIVFQTEMDGLASVPRRQRYLPILAGMICDVTVVAALGVVAALTLPSLIGRLALAVAYATLLRVLWQFMFHLETDIYYLITTVLGTVDLQGSARAVLRDRVSRLRGRPGQDLAARHPRDLRVARWYSWLLLAGWTFSLGLLAIVGIPIIAHAVTLAAGTLVRWQVMPVAVLLDSSVFILITVIQFGGFAWIVCRDRRRRLAARHAT
jgi:hypothetical protein